MLKRTELNMKQAIILLLALGLLQFMQKRSEPVENTKESIRLGLNPTKSQELSKMDFLLSNGGKANPPRSFLDPETAFRPPKNTLKIQEIVHGFSRPDGRTAIKPSSWHLILIEY